MEANMVLLIITMTSFIVIYYCICSLLQRIIPRLLLFKLSIPLIFTRIGSSVGTSVENTTICTGVQNLPIV